MGNVRCLVFLTHSSIVYFLLFSLSFSGGHLLSDVGLASGPQVGAAMIKATLSDGHAMDKFRAMITSQGVSSSTAHELCRPGADVFRVLPTAKHTTDVLAPTTGQIYT